MRQTGKAILLAMVLGAACRGAPPVDRALIDDTLDDYLKQKSLLTLRVFALERKLANSPERGKVLWDLASTYEQLLESLPPDQRGALREKCRTLLKDNPRPELAALRINLLKAEYLAAERSAELTRLRMGSDDAAGEVIPTLKRLASEFGEIANAANTKVRSIEQTDLARMDPESSAAKESRAQLQEARRSRSLAHYYAGWSDCYLALLTGEKPYATDALVHFGTLLNAQDRKAPTLDRLPRTLLNHEHVARACLGTAASYAVLGNDAEALRWLDELSTAEGVPDVVRTQVLSRRISILGASARWSELSSWVQRARAPQGRLASPLEVGDAVLLAVTTFEGEDGPAVRGKELRTELGRVALADLITRSQVDSVVALARRYGTGALASSGFIAQYVRGLQAFDSARADQRRTGQKATEPTSVAAIGDKYKDAANLFLAAARAEDAKVYPKDASRAILNAGMCFFFAGEFVPAAEQFARLAEDRNDEAVRKDGMWYEVVALDRAAAAGRTDLADRREAAAALFVSAYPRTEEAARLLLRRAGVGKLTDAQVVETLLAVPDSSPLRHEARLLAANLLFKLQRAASAADLEAAISRYLAVSDQVLPVERDIAISGEKDVRKAAAERCIQLCRQQLECALTLNPPDLQRADRILDDLDRIFSLTGASPSSIADELAFRRVQIALARSDDAAADRIVESLAASQSEFANAARQLLLRRTVEQLRARPGDLQLAARVVRLGRPVLEVVDKQSNFDPRTNALRDEVAEAAATCFRSSGDAGMRDYAIQIDRGMLDRGGRFTSSLRRLAELSEMAGDQKTAILCWRTLIAGLHQEQPGWFEANYNAIRLQSLTDRAGAINAMKLLELAHPELGPPAWAGKLRSLRDELIPPSKQGGTP
ncbi:MAG: hypothetical protein U0573_11160 [Phycisphaerales bacterium]|nr:hypothetical protein [Planctomycetota bacterium]